MQDERPNINDVIKKELELDLIKKEETKKMLSNGYIACPYCDAIIIDSKSEIEGTKDSMYCINHCESDTIPIILYCDKCERECRVDFNYEVEIDYNYYIEIREVEKERILYDFEHDIVERKKENENQMYLLEDIFS